MDLTLVLPAEIAAHVGVELAVPQLHAVATTPADGAESTAEEKEDPSLLASLLGLAPLLLIGLLGYFMLIRPARRRQRQQAELTSSIDVGDEVVLTSGVVGFISAKEADVYWVEIDDDVQIRVLPGAVSRKFTASTPAGGDGAADAPAAATKPSLKGRAKSDDGAVDDADADTDA